MGSPWFKKIAVALSYRNSRTAHKDHYVLELALLIVVLGIMCLLATAPSMKALILNLYFMPVALAGLYLGRYLAGVTALLCVLSAVIIISCELFNPHRDPVAMVEILALGVWGSVLGLTALVIGTLSDDRIRELDELQESHRTDTLSDALTGVANRRAFEYELRRRLTEWNRRNTPLSLTFVDVDHFKKFNDTYGHRAGDAVLCGVAHRLTEAIRETDLVVRYGGEEFAIIMPDTTLEVAKEVAERTRFAIEDSRFRFEDMTLRLTVSVGVAQIMQDEDGQSLIERADGALYTSKQTGRNCAHVHTGKHCEHFGATLPSAPVSGEQDDYSRVPDDAYTDTATQLPTRKVLIEELKRRLSETKRYDSSMSLMLVQLDALGQLNGPCETVVENVRSVVAEFIRNMMRDSDLVTRFEQNQFAVLMPSTPLDGGVIPAERLRISVGRCHTLKHNGATLAFTVSIGLAASQAGDDPACIMGRAQQAVKMAAEKGGNRSCLHDGQCCDLIGSAPGWVSLVDLPDGSPASQLQDS